VIPTAFLQAWSTRAPWPDLRQVEQDLIICRTLCDLFNAPALKGKIAFRGGTAIHNLLFKQPLRYSEDIDLVQAQPEPIGATVDAIRAALSWLGKCSREQAGHSMHLVFKFTPEIDTQATLKLKVEINTREHASLLGVRRYLFAVENDWYHGMAEIASFEPEELFGTKLRALLQRRRNRDLFDLHQGLEQLPLAPERVIACFDQYLALEGKPITRAMAEQRMLEKLTRSLTEDVAPMLPASVRWSDEDAIGNRSCPWDTTSSNPASSTPGNSPRRRLPSASTSCARSAARNGSRTTSSSRSPPRVTWRPSGSSSA
jgi:predicted nucleotidyltransferase component of viral defense system